MDHLRRTLNSIIVGWLLVFFAALPAYAAQRVKTVNGVALANLKAVGTAAKATVKSINGVDNTSGGGGGTPAFVEFAIMGSPGTQTNATVSITVAAGATIVAGVKWEDADRTPTATSSIDGALTGLTKASAGPGQVYSQLFYKINCSAGAHTVTLAMGSSTAFVHGGAWELSGVTAIDEEATADTGTDAVAATGNITADQNVVVLVAMCSNYVGAGVTPDGNYTEDNDSNEVEFAHRTTSTTGTYNATASLTGSGAHVLLMAAFK